MTTNKTYKPLLIDSALAAADLEQHRFIGFDGNYCAAGAKALGVSDVSTAKGEYAPVAVLGIKVADSAITNGYALDAGIAGQEIRILKG